MNEREALSFSERRNFTHWAPTEVPPQKHITGALLAGLILRGGFSVSKRSSCLAEVHAGDPGTLQ